MEDEWMGGPLERPDYEEREDALADQGDQRRKALKEDPPTAAFVDEQDFEGNETMPEQFVKFGESPIEVEPAEAEETEYPLCEAEIVAALYADPAKQFEQASPFGTVVFVNENGFISERLTIRGREIAQSFKALADRSDARYRQLETDAKAVLEQIEDYCSSMAETMEGERDE